MSDVIRIRVGMAVNYIAHSEREDVLEIPRSEWAAMTPEEREDYLDSQAQNHVENHLDSWAVVEDESVPSETAKEG